jgi:hypothetical protein
MNHTLILVNTIHTIPTRDQFNIILPTTSLSLYMRREKCKRSSLRKVSNYGRDSTGTNKSIVTFPEHCDMRSGFTNGAPMQLHAQDTLPFNSTCTFPNNFLQISTKYKTGQHFGSICLLQGTSSRAKSHNVMNQ